MYAPQAVLLYSTAGSEDEARGIARALIGERLAACVNLLPGMESFYHWKGTVESDREIVVLAKTRPDLAEAARRCIQEHHSYECPCVVVLPIIGGHPPFLDWISSETTNAISDEEM